MKEDFVGMKEFTESMGFIVFFLIGTLAFTMIFGEQITFYYLLLVLAGMVVLNADKFSQLVGRYSRI